jgi:hypothetical protein
MTEVYDWAHITHDFLNGIVKELPLAGVLIVIIICSYLTFKLWYSKRTPQEQDVENKHTEKLQDMTKIEWLDERLKKIEAAIEKCPGKCDFHDSTQECISQTQDCLTSVKGLQSITYDRVERIFILLSMMIKGEYIHNHGDDGKVINIPAGLEEILDVRRDNPKIEAIKGLRRKP